MDKEAWECVRLELVRQAKNCREHHISKYHHSDKEHPLSARITCAACGCSFVLSASKRVGEEGRKYWRCSSFRGGRGVEVAGRTFTPKPMALWSKQPDSSHARYRAKHRKLPAERQMLCTDVEIPAGVPEQAFPLPNRGAFVMSITFQTSRALLRFPQMHHHRLSGISPAGQLIKIVAGGFQLIGKRLQNRYEDEGFIQSSCLP